MSDVTWEQLCMESVRKFGDPAARVYPFIALKPLGRGVPQVRTPLGTGRVIAVMPRKDVNGREYRIAQVVLESELQRYWSSSKEDKGKNKPAIHEICPSRIKPPTSPPPRWLQDYSEASQ
jgi:hypothetical protein